MDELEKLAKFCEKVCVDYPKTRPKTPTETKHSPKTSKPLFQVVYECKECSDMLKPDLPVNVYANWGHLKNANKKQPIVGKSNCTMNHIQNS